VSDTKRSRIQVVQDVSIYEVLLAAHMQMKDQINAGRTTVDWAAIKKQIMQNRPRCEKQVPGALHWLQMWGGGTPGKYVHELKAFVQLCTRASSSVDGEIFSAVGDWLDCLSEEDAIPELAVAVIKAAAQATEKVFCTDKDVRALVSPQKRAESIRANQLLKLSRDLCTRAGVQDRDYVIAVGKVDCIVARFMMKKASKPAFKTLDDIGYHFFTEVLKEPNGIVNPFPKPKDSTETATAKPVAQKPNFIEYTAAGEVDQGIETVMKLKGIELGSLVLAKEADKAGSRPHKIMKIDNDTKMIELQEIGIDGQPKGNVKTVEFIVFTKKYAPTNKSYELMSWPAKDISKDPDRNLSMYKSAALMAVLHLQEEQALPDLTVTGKPAKIVMAKQKYPKGKLELLISSNRLTTVKDGDKEPMGGMLIQSTPKGPQGHSIWLTSPGLVHYFCPAWIILTLSTTNEADKANMELKFRMVTVPLPTPDANSEYRTIEFRLPYLANTRVIKKDEELLYYKPSAAKTEKPGMKRSFGEMEKASSSSSATKGRS